MEHRNDVESIVSRLKEAKNPWDLFPQFRGDWSVFLEDSIQEAFKQRVKPEDMQGFILNTMSDPMIGSRQEVIDILLTCMESVASREYSYSDFTRDILKHSHEDALDGPVRQFFRNHLSGLDRSVVDFYRILVEHPPYKGAPDFVEAMRKNPEGLTSLFYYDAVDPIEDLKILADIPEIMNHEAILKEILLYIEHTEYLEEDLKEFRELYPFPESVTFWSQVLDQFISAKRTLWGGIDSLGLEYLIIPNYYAMDNIDEMKQKIIESIRKNTWQITRAILLLELLQADDYFDCENIVVEEHQIVWSRFYEVLGISGVPYDFDTIVKIMYSVHWRDDFNELQNDIAKETEKVIEDHLESGGSTLDIEISQIRDTRASRFIPDILQSRENEMDSVEIVVHNGLCADVRPLWKTHHGRKYFQTKRIWQFCSSTQFEEIVKDFKELGYELKTIATKAQTSERIEEYELDFLTHIDLKSPLGSIEAGLLSLEISNHPERIQVVKRLLGDNSKWFFIAHEPSTKLGVPLPLERIVSILRSDGTKETRNFLLELLARDYTGDYNYRKSQLTSTYSKIVKGFIDNHDEDVVDALIKVLTSLDNNYLLLDDWHPDEPPDDASQDVDVLIQDILDIVIHYKKDGIFEILQKFYSTARLVYSSHDPDSTAYSLIRNLKNDMKRFAITKEHDRFLDKIR